MSEKNRRLTGLSILVALIVVLQVVASFIKFGPFSITLALAPILIGAAIYGSGAGALLGGVFGVVVLAACVLGWDVGGNILWNANPILTALLCIVKGTAAGFAAGLIYRCFGDKQNKLSTYIAGVVCPVVNTGIFILAMIFLYRNILLEWAGGTDIFLYSITSLAGINFLLELFINIILSVVIIRIINYRK